MWFGEPIQQDFPRALLTCLPFLVVDLLTARR
jgi:flagellar biosynthesis protein FliP